MKARDYSHVPVPNWAWEHFDKLNPTDFVVLLYVIRQTVGWVDNKRPGHRRIENVFTRDEIAIATRLNVGTVGAALNKLANLGLIERKTLRVRAQKIALILTSQESEFPTLDDGKTDSKSRKNRRSETVKPTPTELDPASPKESFKEIINKETMQHGAGAGISEFLMSLGIAESRATTLASIAARNGRDLSQIQSCWGYVNLPESGAKRPLGLLIAKIERDELTTGLESAVKSPDKQRQAMLDKEAKRLNSRKGGIE